MERIGRESIYRDRNAVQTKPATSVGEFALCLIERALRLLHRGLERVRLDPVEHIALLDDVALLEQDYPGGNPSRAARISTRSTASTRPTNSVAPVIGRRSAATSRPGWWFAAAPMPASSHRQGTTMRLHKYADAFPYSPSNLGPSIGLLNTLGAFRFNVVRRHKRSVRSRRVSRR